VEKELQEQSKQQPRRHQSEHQRKRQPQKQQQQQQKKRPTGTSPVVPTQSSLLEATSSPSPTSAAAPPTGLLTPTSLQPTVSPLSTVLQPVSPPTASPGSNITFGEFGGFEQQPASGAEDSRWGDWSSFDTPQGDHAAATGSAASATATSSGRDTSADSASEHQQLVELYPTILAQERLGLALFVKTVVHREPLPTLNEEVTPLWALAGLEPGVIDSAELLRLAKSPRDSARELMPVYNMFAAIEKQRGRECAEAFCHDGHVSSAVQKLCHSGDLLQALIAQVSGGRGRVEGTRLILCGVQDGRERECDVPYIYKCVCVCVAGVSVFLGVACARVRLFMGWTLLIVLSVSRGGPLLVSLVSLCSPARIRGDVVACDARR
jgi:hypothetical protein